MLVVENFQEILFAGGKIAKIACGRYHTAVFTEDAKIFEIHHPNMPGVQTSTGTWTEVKIPAPVLLGKAPTVRSIVCGGWRTLALCEDGSVWRWGSNSSRGKPERIPGLEGKVITKISCGLYECLALTETGEVFHWTNTDAYGDSDVRPLEGSQGITFYDIVSGKFGSAAIATTGEIWTWKTTPAGAVASTPVKSDLQGRFCRELVCGDLHCTALVTDATGSAGVCAWGSNTYQQLGVQGVASAPESEPQFVIDLKGIEISQLRCGAYHNAAVLGPWMGGSRITLVSALREALRAAILSDMKFSVIGLKGEHKDRKWSVHRAIMFTRSNKLASDGAVKDSIMRGLKDEYILAGLEDQNITADHVDSVLEYIYTDRCPMTHDAVPFVYLIAQKLEIPGLITICESRMPQKSGKSSSAASQQFNLLSDLKRMLGSNLASDITFSDDAESVSAHKFILASRCPYYNAMWRQGWKEADARQLPLPDQCSMGAFRSFLNFLYTDQLDVSGDDAVDLLALSHEMDLNTLKYACDRFIAEAVDSSTAVPLLGVADTFEANRLRHACLEMIAADPKLMKTDDFENLPTKLQDQAKSFRSTPKRAQVVTSDDSRPYLDPAQEFERQKETTKESVMRAMNSCSEKSQWTEMEVLSQYLDRVNAINSGTTAERAAKLDDIVKELRSLGDIFPDAKEHEQKSKCSVM